MYLPAIRSLAMLGGLLWIERYAIKCYTEYWYYLPPIKLLAMLGGLSWIERYTIIIKYYTEYRYY